LEKHRARLLLLLLLAGWLTGHRASWSFITGCADNAALLTRLNPISVDKLAARGERKSRLQTIVINNMQYVGCPLSAARKPRDIRRHLQRARERRTLARPRSLMR